MCVRRLAPHRPSAARCRPATLPPRAGQVPRSRSAILTHRPSRTDPPAARASGAVHASVSAASMPLPPARPALAPSSLCWLSGRGGFKPDREFIRAKVSPGRLLPGRGGQGSLFLLLRFPALGDCDCQLLLYSTLACRFQIPPRGGSAIGVGDINPTQVSFLRE